MDRKVLLEREKEIVMKFIGDALCSIAARRQWRESNALPSNARLDAHPDTQADYPGPTYVKTFYTLHASLLYSITVSLAFHLNLI